MRTANANMGQHLTHMLSTPFSQSEAQFNFAIILNLYWYVANGDAVLQPVTRAHCRKVSQHSGVQYVFPNTVYFVFINFQHFSKMLVFRKYSIMNCGTVATL